MAETIDTFDGTLGQQGRTLTVLALLRQPTYPAQAYNAIVEEAEICAGLFPITHGRILRAVRCG